MSGGNLTIGALTFVNNKVKENKIDEKDNVLRFNKTVIEDADNINIDIIKMEFPENLQQNNAELPLQNDMKRKRKSNPNEWTRRKNRISRMAGEEYYASALKDEEGNRVKRAARKMGGRCECKGRGRLCKAVEEETRNEIFKAFWKLNWEDKKIYVRNLVKYEEKKRCRVQINSRRKLSFYYHFQVNNKMISVCKKMFLNTLAIKAPSVSSWVTISNVVKQNLLQKDKKSSKRKCGN